VDIQERIIAGGGDTMNLSQLNQQAREAANKRDDELFNEIIEALNYMLRSDK